MTRNPTPEQTLQRLPKKWAVAIVAALIAYALVQPFVNSRFGWHLPSLASALGMEKSASDKLDSDSSKVTGRPTSAREVNGDGSHAETSKPETRESEEAGDANPSSTSETSLTSVTAPPGSQTETQKTGDEKSSAKQSSETGNSASKVADAKRSKPDSTSNLLYGLLKDTGREVYVSPAGLRYTRGSEEGHRLKHIEKHLKDIPDRPGKHGVFDGDMAQVLRWIDEAFTRGKQGAKGVRKREEDGRTVYEVPFTKPIGYVGGRDGKRDRNPEAKRLRLVVDGDQVITAFPF